MSINNPTHPARRRLGTQEQAARIWGCDVRTIRNRISDGTLTGFKLPGTRAIRVDLNEVERLLEVIPAAKRQPRKPFGPDARIVTVVEPVRAEVVQDES